jgi:hypothetical protein
LAVVAHQLPITTPATLVILQLSAQSHLLAVDLVTAALCLTRAVLAVLAVVVVTPD